MCNADSANSMKASEEDQRANKVCVWWCDGQVCAAKQQWGMGCSECLVIPYRTGCPLRGRWWKIDHAALGLGMVCVCVWGGGVQRVEGDA
ncbi:unnamed protein product [Boreogadus saida]